MMDNSSKYSSLINLLSHNNTISLLNCSNYLLNNILKHSNNLLIPINSCWISWLDICAGVGIFEKM